jgi:hypothetical protein
MYLDKLGRPIQINDKVIYLIKRNRYTGVLKYGEVIKFTPKMVTIQTKNIQQNVSPDKIVVITEQEKFNKDKYPEYYI